MGICASCLRGRDKATRPRQSEQVPLLSDVSDSGNYGDSEQNCERYIQRQQSLEAIVQSTQEYFIDISSVQDAEPAEQVDVGAVPDWVNQPVEFSIPEIQQMSGEEREQLIQDIKSILSTFGE